MQSLGRNTAKNKSGIANKNSYTPKYPQGPLKACRIAKVNGQVLIKAANSQIKSFIEPRNSEYYFPKTVVEESLLENPQRQSTQYDKARCNR